MENRFLPMGIQESAFKNYDPESENVLPLLYQSGYLTIKDYYNDSELYTLGIPNREVEKCLFEIRKRDVWVEGEVSLNCFPGYPFGSIRIIKINQLSNNCSKQFSSNCIKASP